ncbi:hypothetical protein ZIOFF_063955 [Zingiber officinale]|uniref:Uncharacterized protein n=1 Tax=Zingiber officinale TaxID=94328 RepID=A0A8J5F2K4_ZINOF|nr:hypothetical protein ZIOFF_063955 [Zingiber officinale]
MKRMQQLVDDTELRKKNFKPKEVMLPSSSVSSNIALKSSFSGPLQNDDPTPTKKRKGPLGSLEKAFNLNVRDELHFEIARLFTLEDYHSILLRILIMFVLNERFQYTVRNNLLVPQAHRSHYAKWSLRKLTANEPTMPRSDLEASVGSDIRGMPIKAAPFPQNLPRFPDAISIRKSLKPKDGISDRNPTRRYREEAFAAWRGERGGDLPSEATRDFYCQWLLLYL